MPAAQVPADAFLVDVREPDEWTAGHAPGPMHIPLGQLGARYTEIPQDGQVYVICRAWAAALTRPRSRWPGRAGTWST